ncbi:MAG TPA: DUF6600 domain-containing protein [Blastocatellia bacterium]|nr:DUF6600 domain-containing protein [Blastocatellia bacterium]
MVKKIIKAFSNVPPHVAIISVLVAVVGVSGAALLLSRSGPKAEALITPRAARIERVEGSVGLAHSLDPNSKDQPDWVEAGVNTPLTVGDRVYAREKSHAAIAFTGRNYARLDPGASLDVLSLADRRTQLALRDGSALFDIGELADGELFEVGTPGGAIDFNEPGLYQVGIGDDGNTLVSVLSGLAQVVGLEGSGQIGKGEILTLVGQAATQLLASKLAPDLAGDIVDDYYSSRYPNTYDGRYSDYDAYLDDPHYYDPYSQSASYNYLSDEIPGLYDLDRYGDWEDVDGYGRCWTPRVDASWSPYRSGYWDVNDLWGPTWVADEPWGWAPYHYGRWAYVNRQRWVWVPENCRTNPEYAPALVAFVPLQQTNQIGWCPLGPGERYVPRYYDANFQPRYIGPRGVVEVVNVQNNYANLNYPDAVTVIPVQDFRRRVDRRALIAANPQLIAQSQAVTDPFAVEGLRQAAMNNEFSDRRMKMPRDFRRGAFNTPVVTSVAPAIPPVRADVAEALQVQAVPDRQKKNRLKINDSGQVVAARRADGLPQAFTQRVAPAVNQQRQQRMAELAARVQQGDKTAQPELRTLKREQRKEERAVQQQAAAGQQAAGQQVAAQQAAREQQQQQSRRQLRELERQQRAAGQQAQADQTREQFKAQRRMERQQRATVIQQQQQPAARQNNQREQMKAQRQMERAQRQAAAQSQINQQQQQQQFNQAREQRKAQRQAERQQSAMIERQKSQAAARQAAQQSQMNQQREQRKAQRQVERQQQQAQQQQFEQRRQQQVQQQQVQQQREQRKAQRQVERQQQIQQQSQQQVQQMQQQREQRKAQRQAERQQQPQTRAPALMGPPARQNPGGQGQGKNKRKP